MRLSSLLLSNSTCGWLLAALALLGCSGTSETTNGGSLQAPACEPSPASEETVNVPNAYGVLEGTLVLPASCGTRPVALLVPGSGPTDRDGNQQGGIAAQSYRLLAAALAEEGVGSLRYDKAGIAASAKAGPVESDLRFEMGAEDTARLIETLRRDPRVGKITLVGHSEGSLVGMLAVARAPADAFVSLAGAGRPAAPILREQLARNLADPALLAKANAIIDALEKGERVDDVPKDLMVLFRPTVQPYIISWMKRDPALEIAAMVTSEVLIVHGTTDIQLGVTEAHTLAAARPDARIVIVDGMNHVLKRADASSASQRDAYTNASLPLVPELVRELASFAKPAP